jgi:uncharacterized coiled-coil DUF342 family protein
MIIDEKIINEERDTLKKDFDTINQSIKKMENDLKTMKNNLNAVYGAIQQCDKFLKILQEKDDKGMSEDKQEALTLATS